MALEANTAGLQVNALVTPQRPLGKSIKLTAANTNRYAPTAAVPFWANNVLTKGARITDISFIAADTVTASEIQLYIYDGTNYFYLDSETLPAFSISNIAKNTTKISLTWSESKPLVLNANEGLYAATAVASANGIYGRAMGGAYE